MADGTMYIRLLGRHAMPHIFHTNDFIKMMNASRRASIVLRYVKLPANYPILMYNASAGGAHKWLGGIRPRHQDECVCQITQQHRHCVPQPIGILSR